MSKEIKNIVYIAGPMTGIEEYNRKGFAEAEEELSMSHLNEAIINPRHNFCGNDAMSWHTYMRLSIHQLLCAQSIYMLRGWENSKGALAEWILADALGLEIRIQPGAAKSISECQKMKTAL